MVSRPRNRPSLQAVSPCCRAVCPGLGSNLATRRLDHGHDRSRRSRLPSARFRLARKATRSCRRTPAPSGGWDGRCRSLGHPNEALHAFSPGRVRLPPAERGRDRVGQHLDAGEPTETAPRHQRCLRTRSSRSLPPARRPRRMSHRRYALRLSRSHRSRRRRKSSAAAAAKKMRGLSSQLGWPPVRPLFGNPPGTRRFRAVLISQ